MIISNVTQSSFDVVFVRNKEGNTTRRYPIKETTFIYFYYPAVVLVKGGMEVLAYSIPEDTYYYYPLKAPILFQSSITCSYYDVRIKVFIDLGDYLAFAEYTFYLGTTSSSGTIYKRYLEKANFPDSPLITGFDTMQCKFGTKEEDSYILQFKDFIYYLGLLTYGLQSTVDAKFDKGELMAISGEGFLTYKRDKKSLEFYSRPSNLGDVNSSYSLYESQDYIKRVQADYDSYNGYYHINIADEVKYLKRYKFDTSKDKRKLVIADEFFVHSSFDGSKNFRFTNNMVYENGTEAYLCQKRGDELEGAGATISPLIEAIDTYEVTDEYPLQSQRWLLIYGPLTQDDNEDDEDGAGSYYTEEGEETVGKNGYGAILLPEYNQPKVQILPPNDVSYYKAEYFYYQNNNYMVYHKQSYNHSDHVKIDIFWRNGDFYQNMKLKLHNCYDHSYAKIILSPSGRYIFYVEEDKDNPEISWGRTAELTLNPETKEFYLKEVSKLDFTKAYEKKASDINTYDYYGGTELYLTDKKELIYIHKSESIIKFDAQQVDKKQFEGKFGKDNYDNTRDRTLNDVNVKAKNGGVAVYTEEECWFIRYDSREKKIYPMERINFQINKGQMTINQI